MERSYLITACVGQMVGLVSMSCSQHAKLLRVRRSDFLCHRSYHVVAAQFNCKAEPARGHFLGVCSESDM